MLVELDATNARADGASVSEQLGTALSEERRTQALRDGDRVEQAGGRCRSHRQAAQPQRDVASGQRAASGRMGGHHRQARQTRLPSRRRSRPNWRPCASCIAKLETTMPIARQREADFKSLSEQGFMSSHAGQDRTRERIELERDLATQRARLGRGAGRAARKPSHARGRLPRGNPARIERAPCPGRPQAPAADAGAGQGRAARPADPARGAGGRHGAAAGRAHRRAAWSRRRRC